MVLFSRNPRFRFLSKLYGFFLIIGSGSFQWLRLNKLLVQEKTFDVLKAMQSGENPLDKYANFSVLEQATLIKDKKFQSTLELLRQRENIKNQLIDEEEFIRMEIWKTLHKKNKL